MTEKEWIKKAGKHIPDGGYNNEILSRCIFMFKEGYQEAIADVCEWLKEHSYDYLEFGQAGFGASLDYPKMIEDLKKVL